MVSRRRSTVLVMLLGVTTLLVATLVTPNYRILYNASDSAPRGWYALIPAREVSIGILVFVRLPPHVRELAAERGYLPRSVLLLKHVAANSGQSVCSRSDLIVIEGQPVGRVLTRDGAGRPLPHWKQCRSLEPDELFLLGGDNPASFDSRYFGPVNVASVVGEAIPLWTW